MSPDYISSRVRTWRPFFCFNPAAHFCLLLLVCASPRVIAAQGPEYFAGDPHVLDARISPDGAWLLKRVRDAASRRLKIEIYDAARPNSAAQLVADGTWEYESSAWVGNSHVMVALAPVGDQNAEEDSPAAGILDVRDGQLRPLHAHVDRLENALVADEDSIIVSAPSGAAASTPDVGMPGFEPRDYYSVSLAGYDLEPIDQIGLPLANIDFDSKGTPLIARTVDAKIGQVRWWHRPQGEWRAFRSQPLSGVAEFLVFGQDPDKEGHIIVAARNGHDKLGAWSFDTATGRFAELLYRREDVDARGVRQHSNTWQNPARIVGLGYHTDRWHYEYFDAEEAALYAQLADLVDNSHELQVLSRSRNGDMLTFVNRGPRDAGTFYMLRNGRLIIVGKSLPEISATDLSAVRYTTLDAAGNSIPVFLMRPAGDPPFPAVVLVPNGLFSHVSITYDALAQLLAHRGYLVAQPILPGMLGYGAKFTEAATSGGGQGGFDMLTDIQTVARKLVEE